MAAPHKILIQETLSKKISNARNAVTISAESAEV